MWRWSRSGCPASRPGCARVSSEPVLLAGDLAGFVAAMRTITLQEAPAAYCCGPVASLDASTRAAIEELRGIPQEGVDCDAAYRGR